MAEVVDASIDTQTAPAGPRIAEAPPLSPVDEIDARRADAGRIQIDLHEDFGSIADDWRRFEATADGTVFQGFDWLACWLRHIGARDGVRPAIAVGRKADGAILFILPLAVRVGLVREFSFLASELCDYNAPLLAPDFATHVGRADFPALWQSILDRLQANPRLQFDMIRFTKMPERVGAQANPMLALPVTLHPSGAYLTHLAGDWDAFYAAKRSSATRRRDRTKRKRLGEFGEVTFVDPQTQAEVSATLETLMAQKAKSFARMGIGNLFARPGYADFYRALATDAQTRARVHVSRLDVGETAAAVNLGLIWRGCYYHLLASYDDGEVSRFGPGAAHLHDLMRYALGRGLGVFDFTIGDERYKRDWCDTELRLYDCIAGVTLSGRLMAAAMTAVLRLKRAIKQTPVLWSMFSMARSLVGALKRPLRG
jgi:CelD/BcsL family acetyltransferase involved in cellulose biosynthesis